MSHDSSVQGGRPGSSIYPTSSLGDREAGIATGRDVAWEPLVDYRRNGVSETTIHGAIAWASGDRIIHSFGGNVLCYGRSMMKPFMMKVFADELAEVLGVPPGTVEKAQCVVSDGKPLGKKLNRSRNTGDDERPRRLWILRRSKS